MSNNPPPLAKADFAALGEAKARAKKVRRAAGVASFGGWTTGFFAVVSILFGLFDPPSLAIGLALGMVAFHEFRGGAALRRFDERAPARLAFNQVGCAILILAYAAVGYHDATTGIGIAERVAVGDPGMDAMIARLESTVNIALYGSIATVGLLVPSFTSLYYATRRSHLRRFLAQTPPWAIRALCASA